MYLNISDGLPLIRQTQGISATYTDARCGAGKTRAAVRMMATTPAKWLYAVDRKAAMIERVEDIKDAATEAGAHPPHIIEIHSEAENAARKPIENLIRERLATLGRVNHVAVMITHAGLNACSHATFPDGWHLIVDEAPDLVEIRSMDTGPWAVPSLAHFYALDEHGRVSLIRSIPASEFDRSHVAPFRQFHDMVRRGGTVALRRVEEEEKAGQAVRRTIPVNDWAVTAKEAWFVARAWDPTMLAKFRTVHFLADSFAETIAFHALRSAGVEFAPRILDDARVWRSRPVSIEFFADDHSASAYQWRKAGAGTELSKIARYLSEAKLPQEHLWTTNALIRDHFLGVGVPGEPVTPRQAGSNQWAGWHQASIIYSARPSPDEIAVLEAMGMSEDDIVRARQGNDLKQFVLRTSLRDPDSAAPVILRVYDKWQAAELKSYLDASYGFDCEVVHIDVGVKVPEDLTPRRVLLTHEEKKARKSVRNARNYRLRAAKKASPSDG
jgi:hypothetical protein